MSNLLTECFETLLQQEDLAHKLTYELEGFAEDFEVFQARDRMCAAMEEYQRTFEVAARKHIAEVIGELLEENPYKLPAGISVNTFTAYYFARTAFKLEQKCAVSDEHVLRDPVHAAGYVVASSMRTVALKNIIVKLQNNLEGETV